MRPLRESLLGEDISRVMGIVNGTTNFILTRMTEEGAAYAEALAEAQSSGYAERDPTADVEGYDAGAKAAIIASIAFGARVVAGDVYHEGISGITADRHRVRRPPRLRRSSCSPSPSGSTGDERPRGRACGSTRRWSRSTHPLAGVRDSFNAVFVEGEAVGDLMFYGRGAGGDPTALGRARRPHRRRRQPAQGHPRRPRVAGAGARIRPIDELRSPATTSASTSSTGPACCAAIAEVFERHEVSIRSMEQEGIGDEARIVFITHVAREADLQATLADLREPRRRPPRRQRDPRRSATTSEV